MIKVRHQLYGGNRNSVFHQPIFERKVKYLEKKRRRFSSDRNLTLHFLHQPALLMHSFRYLFFVTVKFAINAALLWAIVSTPAHITVVLRITIPRSPLPGLEKV